MRNGPLSLVAAILILGSVVSAQNISATVVGAVKDETGAILPGVAITVTHVQTNQSQHLLTDDSGAFRAPLLPPGQYTVTAELHGFRTEVRSGIVLQVDQIARVDLTLSVGEVNERIEVTADAPLVQSESSTVGNVIDQRKIVELPLNGRQFEQLAILVPGGAPPAEGSRNSFRGGINLAGAREKFNNFLLDGVDNNNPAVQTFTFRPSIDMIQEFKVQSNTFGAEFGRASAAQVNVITKSGTNEFHGNTFGFLRNAVLDARNFFDSKNDPIPPFRRVQFGGTIGGPIVKDRTFFFANYEGLRLFQAITSAARTLPVNWRVGDFSDVSAPVRDPLTGQPFAGNRIPGSRINQKGSRLAALWPEPNRQDPTRNLVSTPPTTRNENQFSVRVDHQVNEKHKFFGRYSFDDNPTEFPFPALTQTSGLPGFGRTEPRTGTNVGLVVTSVLTNNIVNEARVGFNRVREARIAHNINRDVAGDIGIPGFSRDPRDLGVPTINVRGFDRFGDESPQDRGDNLFHYVESLTWNAGRHSLKIGGDARRFQLNLFITQRETLTFDGRYSGNPVADLLLGFPTQTTRQVAFVRNTYFRQSSFSAYIQDDWKTSKGLTLNLGIRWELNTPIIEHRNTYSWFNKTNATIKVAGRDGNPRSANRLDKNNFAPRVGFAWTPSGNASTVFRGGAGVYYDIEDSAAALGVTQNFPFRSPETYNASTTTPNISLDDPFPRALLAAASLSPAHWDENFRTSYTYNWSLGLQRELLPDLVLDASYIGSKGTKLNNRRNINQALPGPGSIPSRRPYPAFGNIAAVESTATSSFNAMIVRAEKRFSSGLSFLSSYTYGHAIDLTSGDSSDSNDRVPQNNHNYRGERGNSEFDTRHRYVFSYVYQLPWGGGRSSKLANPIADALLGNWEFSGIVTLQGGRPFTPKLASDNTSTGNRSDRPNLIGDWRLSKPDPAQWVNPAAFTIVPGQFGNAGRNVLTGPGTNNFDMSFMKSISWREDGDIQFRAEFFNILNHPNFKLPNRIADGAQFGKVFSANFSRQIQFGLKIDF